MGYPQGKVTTGRAYIKFKGLYDWDGLYKLIYSWLQNRRYEVHDKRYKDKHTTSGSELKVDITAGRRETVYTKRHFDLKIRIWDMKERPMEIDGHTKLMTGGRFWMEIKTSVHFDWQGLFKGSAFKEALGRFYDWVMKKDHELRFIDDQEYETLRLEHVIKKHLNMETATMEYEETN